MTFPQYPFDAIDHRHYEIDEDDEDGARYDAVQLRDGTCVVWKKESSYSSVPNHLVAHCQSFETAKKSAHCLMLYDRFTRILIAS